MSPTTDRSARIVQALVAVHDVYGKPITELALDVWLNALEGIEPEQVEAALQHHVRDTQRGQWCPMPADVLRFIRGNAADAATVAWSRVLDLVRTYGAGSVPPLDEPTRKAIDSLGGWGAICRAQERDLPHLQRRFAETHEVWRQRIERDAALPLLAAGDGHDVLALLQ